MKNISIWNIIRINIILYFFLFQVIKTHLGFDALIQGVVLILFIIFLLTQKEIQ
jgi:hypothetical protein